MITENRNFKISTYKCIFDLETIQDDPYETYKQKMHYVPVKFCGKVE